MGRIRGSAWAWLEPSCDATSHVRPLLRNGALLRWCVVALVAVRVIADPPQLTTLAILWILLAGACNTALPLLGERLAPPRAARAAQAAVLTDTVALVALVQIIFAGKPDVLSGGVALVLLEAVICWGAPGVLITVGLTLASLSALEGARCWMLGEAVGWSGIGAQYVGIGLLSAALVMARRLFGPPLGPHPPAEAQRQASGPRLTSREREVLALLAEGCSNTMIARRLDLTESTIKGHVESILNRLDVRNRAGAVAVASQLGLLD